MKLAADPQPYRVHQYVTVINPCALVIARLPWDTDRQRVSLRWRDVLRGLTPVMHAHGCRQKDISEIEGFDRTELDVFQTLDAAFKGNTDRFARFHLYEWDYYEFRLVRPAAVEDAP